ncbi:hypothetical protein EV401DRAFT_1885107 [Pisolithus croceorrhizus]|nr:hypothetical protein EV401DRAFT_1885107 [Pisolithus croceorrhizus]
MFFLRLATMLALLCVAVTNASPNPLPDRAGRSGHRGRVRHAGDGGHPRHPDNPAHPAQPAYPRRPAAHPLHPAHPRNLGGHHVHPGRQAGSQSGNAHQVHDDGDNHHTSSIDLVHDGEYISHVNHSKDGDNHSYPEANHVNDLGSQGAR